MRRRTAASIVVAGATALALGPAGAALASNGDRVAVSSPTAGAAALPLAPATATVEVAVQLRLRDAAAAEAVATAVGTPATRSTATTSRRRSSTRASRHRRAGSGGHEVPHRQRPARRRRAEQLPLRRRPGHGGPGGQGVRRAPAHRHPSGRPADRHRHRRDRARSIAPAVLTVTGLDGTLFHPGSITQDGGAGRRGRPQHRPDPVLELLEPEHRDHADGLRAHRLPDQHLRLQRQSAGVGLRRQGSRRLRPRRARPDRRPSSTPTTCRPSSPTPTGCSTTGTSAASSRGQYTSMEPTSYQLQSQCGEASWRLRAGARRRDRARRGAGREHPLRRRPQLRDQGLLTPLNKIVNGHLADIVSNSWGNFGEGS